MITDETKARQIANTIVGAVYKLDSAHLFKPAPGEDLLAKELEAGRMAFERMVAPELHGLFDQAVANHSSGAPVSEGVVMSPMSISITTSSSDGTVTSDVSLPDPPSNTLPEGWQIGAKSTNWLPLQLIVLAAALAFGWWWTHRS